MTSYEGTEASRPLYNSAEIPVEDAVDALLYFDVACLATRSQCGLNTRCHNIHLHIITILDCWLERGRSTCQPRASTCRVGTALHFSTSLTAMRKASSALVCLTFHKSSRTTQAACRC